MERGLPVSLAEAQLKSLTIFAGVAGVVDSWPTLVPLVQEGRIRAEGMFTHELPLDRGADAFALFDSGQDTVLKILIHVAEENR